MVDRLPSSSGRRPLLSIDESPAMRSLRNTFGSRADASSCIKTDRVSPPSTAILAQRRSPRATTRTPLEFDPPKRTAKRSRTHDDAVSTPRKTRKLVPRFDTPWQATPESAKYDSGIEMTPESTIKLSQSAPDTRSPSPCDLKRGARLPEHQPACGARPQVTATAAKKRKNPGSPALDCASHTNHWADIGHDHRSQHDCIAVPLFGREEPETRDFAKLAGTKVESPGHALDLSLSSSGHQRSGKADTTDLQTIWQPAGTRQDIGVLLNILGETVVQQQRTRTGLQRWLQNHDDHLMFWLNYGGTSSPSDYLRWTKRVRTNHDLKNL